MHDDLAMGENLTMVMVAFNELEDSTWQSDCLTVIPSFPSLLPVSKEPAHIVASRMHDRQLPRGSYGPSLRADHLEKRCYGHWI